MDNKYKRLQEILNGYGKLLVAYSGGLDSGFLLWAAMQTLGPENVLGVIGDSPSYASGEKEGALGFAREIGLPDASILVIETEEIKKEGYVANSYDRCFHCKTELYGKLTKIAAESEFPVIADGFNASDKSDFRPGHKAAQDYKIVSPLADAGLTKSEIIVLAAEHNLRLADKPASACLSSRIPFGQPVTIEKLTQIDKAELGLKNLGLKGLRVRHHNEVARLEMAAEDIARVSSDGLKDEVIAVVKRAGFKYVTIDLEGYRMGSFNPEPDKTKGTV